MTIIGVRFKIRSNEKWCTFVKHSNSLLHSIFYKKSFMQRRKFLQWSSIFGFIGVTQPVKAVTNSVDLLEKNKKQTDRQYWVSLLDKIATPILANMSQGLLKKNMHVEFSPTKDKRNPNVAYMEAFGRLLAGIAPFLALPKEDSVEGAIRERLHQQSLASLAHAVNPDSADYLYWGTPKDRQPLVDAAFIAQAFLAAPNALWQPLSEETKKRFIKEFVQLRQIPPVNSNWVLFAAIIESFLLNIDVAVDAKRIDNAIEALQKWYVGDGWYSDGDKFHFDHYNGYVMHPMLIEVLRVNVAKGRRKKEELDIAYKRMQRYATFQERYISPEGTYLVVGRSSTYRVGAFQPLVKPALENTLPEEILPAQVRCALTVVMMRMFIPSTFTNEGWLTLGLVGNQQANIADSYTNTGSLYLTSLVFLPLGLPATHDFWSAPFAEWTQMKAWSGKPFKKDYAVDY
jgi:hypothetical protein